MTTSSSPVTWSIALLAVYNGLQSVANLLPTTWAVIVNIVVGALAIYLHKGQIVAGKAR